MGKFREYSLYYDKTVVAKAQIMPKIFIFDFMDRKGLHIGPCWTHPDFRGQGLYPYLIKKVMDDYKNAYRNFYMFTSTDNISSQRGIEKAGGVLFAYGYKNKFGIYKISRTIDLLDK
jgi:predicted GNAT family acetyltransferase